MQVIEAQTIHNNLDFEGLMTAIHKAFAAAHTMPRRQVHELGQAAAHGDALAVLPAWNDEVIGCKLFTYFPDNLKSTGLPILHSKMLLFNRRNGVPMAMLDGTSLTLWRTAAVSALASRFLSRKDSRKMVLFGTGNLAEYLVSAHLQTREIDEIVLIGRDLDKAQSLAEDLDQRHSWVKVRSAADVSSEITGSDIIVCATSASEPLFDGRLLAPGTHVDCLGNHQPKQRECDSHTISRARILVDSRINCLYEAGELLIPMSEGQLSEDDICANLAALCRSEEFHRHSDDEITLFKSVGTALSDLAAAHHVYERINQK